MATMARIASCLLLLLLPIVSAFVGNRGSAASLPSRSRPNPSTHAGRRRQEQQRQQPRRWLIPLSNFDESISFFSEPDEYRCCINREGFFSGATKDDAPTASSSSSSFELGLLEDYELPDLCRFVVETFGAEAIQLSSDINSFEKMLLNPAAEFLNGYSGMVAFAEVFSGTKQRVADRLEAAATASTTTTTASTDPLIAVPDIRGLSDDEKIRKAEKTSLVLILARRSPPDSSGSKTVEIVASIELRLQPCDAKIPFSLPWLDRVERKLGSWIGLGRNNGRQSDDKRDTLQPYLSNLCVGERYRGRRIGRALVRCVENIAETGWGYHRMYLHVDEDNPAALNLYKSEGYKDVGQRWNPFWSGRASDIGYYVKSLNAGSKPR